MADPQAPTLAARLAAYHAVMFGLDEGCAYTAQAKRAWGPALGAEIAYVACDRSPQEEALCGAAGISTTPTLSFGGVQFPGFVPLPKVADLLDLADGVGAKLGERRATLFTRPGCSWCDRQRLMLGPLAARVDVVNCDVDRRRCADAGVRAVPAWRIGDDASGAPTIPGYRVLPELQAMARADAAELRHMAASVASAGGGDKTC
jgi:glutaredoxin